MLDILKALRYFVFVVFVICNAVITSVAVWNLSLVQAVALDATAKQVDAFLIFVGASGLVLVFPILFLDLFGKDFVVQRVWFELLWVGLYWVMELAGAATITSQSNTQLCDSKLESLAATLGLGSPCPSAQVLQAFTFICAILLLGYLTLLALSATYRSRSDPAIWHRSVRKFPWFGVRIPLHSAPESPSTPRFRDNQPRIVAPQPQRTIPFSEAFVSHRRGISDDYAIEHFRFPIRESEVDRPVPPIPAASAQDSRTRQRETSTSQPIQPIQSTAFYPNHVQIAIHPNRPPNPAQRAPEPTHIQSQSTQIRPLPPSPPPLGDWPRLDAPVRGKRKPLPSMPPTSQPQPQPRTPSSFTFDPAVLSSALEPLESPSRSRPFGPRRRTSSGDYYRPPDLDLSRISNHRTKDSS